MTPQLGAQHGEGKQVMILPLVLMVMAAALMTQAESRGQDASTKVPQPQPVGSEVTKLVLAAPVRSWDEALPLGNGLLGGLLWGQDGTLRLSLDRGDLWDERPHAEPGWWKKRTWKVGGDWDGPYAGATPTKLPAGRLEITLDGSQKVLSFELDLPTAVGAANFADGQKLEVFFSAAAPVAWLRLPGPEPKELALIPSGAKRQAGDAGPSSGGAVAGLGYPPARCGREGRAQWYVQDAVDGFQYCVCLESVRVGQETLVAVTVTSTNDAPDVLALARRRCAAALQQGDAALWQAHVAWWRTFWEQSSISIPEPRKCRSTTSSAGTSTARRPGAAHRRCRCRAFWTADNGGLPPWKGDYHNDLNTQLTYIAYHARRPLRRRRMLSGLPQQTEAGVHGVRTRLLRHTGPGLAGCHVVGRAAARRLGHV